jgi:hypothetical protein
LFGSFLPSLLVGQHHQLYSATGADIVMESITLIDSLAGRFDIPFRRYPPSLERMS